MSTESNIAGVNAASIGVNNQVTPGKPITGNCVVTGANTSYTDTPANSVELVAAQTKGCRLISVTALARATNTATELQLFTSKDSGTTKKFLRSALLSAYTVAATTKQTPGTFNLSEADAIYLEAGESLYAAIGVANTGIVFRAEGGAYV